MMAKSMSALQSADSSECDLDSISVSTNRSELNCLFLEDFSKWRDALKNYIETTEATYLNLHPKRVGVKEAAAVYKFLRDSEVTDLIISCNKLRGGIKDLVALLVASKIETLSLCRCIFSNDELLRLMEALKDTQITELNILDCDSTDNEPIEFDPDEGKEFISHLLKSRLTLLNFQPHFVQPVDDSLPFSPADITPLLGIMHKTSITNLDLSNTTFSSGILTSLFSTLSCMAITDLNLCNTNIREDDLKQLSLNLKESKLVILDLSKNDIEDFEVDILGKGLLQSKITALNLSETSVTGSCSLGVYLKDSQIIDLYLSSNAITSENLFSFPEFLKLSSVEVLSMNGCQLEDELGQKLMKSLKSSKVTHLDVSCNYLMNLSIDEFSVVIRDTAISYIDLSYNFFSTGRAAKLGDCLKDSKLETVKLNCAFSPCCTCSDPVRALSTFLEKTKGSSLKYLDVAGYKLKADGMKEIATSLVNTTLMHLDLTANHIEDNIAVLALQLKFTAITHLHLGHNKLGDGDVEILVNCLSDTKIIHLDLHDNAITDCGAKVLASALKGSLLQLHLAANQITNEGLEVLAKQVEGTFITILDVTNNPGNRTSLLDRIIYENKTLKHQFLSFFELIAPESNSTSFQLDSNIEDDENADVFLEECLLFYKTALEQSSAAIVLAKDGNPSFSKDQIAKLLFEEFPKQFTSFVLNKIEASATQHVDFLKKAEELGLFKIVEPLLLNRPALTIDENANILHPYVYNLLRKYKQPLYNLSIEPEGKTKIIEYFRAHSDLEGAVDVISMLCNNLSLE